jgi:hypothetical protein
LRQYGINSALLVGVLLIAYTVIGTIQGTHQYHLVQKRISRYLHLVQTLERIETRASRQLEKDKEEEPDGRDALVYNKR